jgi:hypothetical protein
MDESPKPKSSWWQTLPGVLTAVAAAATAIAGLIGGLHTAGLLGGGNVKPAPAPTEQLCSARTGYPTGRWRVIDKSNPSPSSSTFVIFTRPAGGTWVPYTGQGSFESFPTPSPGAEVVLKLRVDSANYVSTNNLVVSADGCRMDGTYNDTEGHKGEASYFYDGK